jgi:hypothetical protein
VEDTKYYGVYRAVVTASKDPKGLNRLKVQVPQIMGDVQTDWVWNIEGVSYDSEVPEVGQGVWVMFVAGDVDQPIWIGTAGKTKKQRWHTYLKTMPPATYPDSIKTRKSSRNQTQFDLIQTIITMAQKIETLEEDVDVLQSEMDTAQANISNLQNRVSALESNP